MPPTHGLRLQVGLVSTAPSKKIFHCFANMRRVQLAMVASQRLVMLKEKVPPYSILELSSVLALARLIAAHHPHEASGEATVPCACRMSKAGLFGISVRAICA